MFIDLQSNVEDNVDKDVLLKAQVDGAENQQSAVESS